MMDLKRDKHLYVLIAPYMLLFFIFTVLPVAISILISLTYFNMLEFPRWAGWANYSRLFLDDDIFLIALKNTLIFAVITGPISYIACFVFAWLINELRPKVRAFMTLIFLCTVDFREYILYLANYVLWRCVRDRQRFPDENRIYQRTYPMVPKPEIYAHDHYYCSTVA